MSFWPDQMRSGQRRLLFRPISEVYPARCVPCSLEFVRCVNRRLLEKEYVTESCCTYCRTRVRVKNAIVIRECPMDIDESFDDIFLAENRLRIKVNALFSAINVYYSTGRTIEASKKATTTANDED